MRIMTQSAASAMTPSQTSERRSVMTRAMKSLVRIMDLARMRPRLKPENEGFRSRAVAHEMSIFRVNKLVAQRKPAAQCLRSAINETRPTAASYRTLHFGEIRIFTHDEQCHRTLRKCQFEILRGEI